MCCESGDHCPHQAALGERFCETPLADLRRIRAALKSNARFEIKGRPKGATCVNDGRNKPRTRGSTFCAGCDTELLVSESA